MGTLADFIKEYGISSTYERASHNPAFSDSPHMTQHWRVTLRRGFPKHGAPTSITVVFSQGSAHTEPPTTDDVLDCLASDAAGYDNARSFDEWCDEYGYTADYDDRDEWAHARCIYQAVERQSQDLLNFLGGDSYQELLWDIERE